MSPSSKDVEPRDGISGPTIFVSDPSAEADRLSNALRARGYHVIDVPPSLLLARVAVQVPAVILLDIDAEGAVDLATGLREVPGSSGIDILFLGDAGRTLAGSAEGLRHEGSGFLERPVDVDVLIRKVDALVGARPSLPAVPMHTEPPARRPSTSSRERPSVPPPRSSRGHASDPWPSRRGTEDPLDVPFGSEVPAAPRPPLPELSSEVAQLLSRAEERARQELGPSSQPSPSSQPPSPDEEVDAVLPAEVLAALDEPLDENDDDLQSDSGLSTGVPRRGNTVNPDALSAHVLPPESGLTAQPASADAGAPADSSDATLPPPALPPGARAPAASAVPSGIPGDPKELETPRPPRRNAASAVPSLHVPAAPAPPRDARSSPAATARDEGVTGGARSAQPSGSASPAGRPSGRSGPPPPPPRPSATSALEAMAQGGPSTPRSAGPTSPRLARDRDEGERPEDELARATFALPPMLTPGDALSAFAICVRERATGALCIEAPEGMRRILLREGDVVTAASGLDEESLVAFLGSRGDVSPDVADHLQGKIPAYGRHAGAALVANGHISQDQLWPVLRAHAEWILRCTVAVDSGSATFEPSPPGRLKAEPSVFGGSTGAEVLIEVVRRAFSPSTALGYLGGGAGRLGPGTRWELLSECALPDWELGWLNRVLGMDVDEAVTLATPDVLPVLYAMAELGVISVQLSPVKTRDQRPARALTSFDAIDAQAVRAQVKTRLLLVQEGDYFALLGVPRSATSYEVHRAYIDLRRSLEPSRVLTAATADLADDLALILEVIDEAHEILRDQTRRERYRRAIEDRPPS